MPTEANKQQRTDDKPADQINQQSANTCQQQCGNAQHWM